jgi:hypothetical protein
MKYNQLIDELLQELSYRVGIVDIYNKEQQSIMSEILTEWGELEAKETFFKVLNEEEERFKNPLLNKKIKYVSKTGEEKEGTIGNLITLAKDQPGRIEAEKELPAEGTSEREEINQEIGSQGGGGPQDGQQGGESELSDIEQKKSMERFTKDPYIKKQLEKEKEVRQELEEDDLKNNNVKNFNNLREKLQLISSGQEVNLDSNDIKKLFNMAFKYKQKKSK